MKIVCAWCGRGMVEKDGKRTEETSHGICGECIAKLEAKCADNYPIKQSAHILVRYLVNHVTLD
jgi:hypothetical protein